MRFTSRSTLVPLVVVATSVSAQSITSLGLVSVLSATGSIITPLTSWLGGACTQTCSSATLSTAESTIQSGCASDITSGAALATGLQTLTSNYTAVKDVLCLQAVSNSTYCLTNLLTSVEAATGSPVNVSSVTSLLTGGTAGFATLLSTLPASTLCTDCTHALVSKLTVLAKDTSTSTSSLSSVSSECGASFTDGTIPSTVQEGTSAASSSASSTSAVTSTSLSGASTLVPGLGGAMAVAMVAALAGGVWTMA
ncbi:hypothetical protein RQP46_010770 [Phenoliferia psychrophenolica]